jgi:MFS family permease
VEGAGGSALQPLSQAILLESYRPAKRRATMALFGLGVVVAPVLGATLGGWLTDQYTWRWAFYINIPVGVLALFMINRFVKDPPYIEHAKVGRIDSIRLGLLAIGWRRYKSFWTRVRKTIGSAPRGFGGPSRFSFPRSSFFPFQSFARASVNEPQRFHK